MKIGVISDTHEVIHPAVFGHFAGVSHILHAGDLGSDEVLETLRHTAPLTAVRGNVDHWPGAGRLPESIDVCLGGVRIHMTHIGLAESDWTTVLDRRPPGDRPRIVVCGHTHVPRRSESGGYLFLNPGSAGRRRFGLPLSIAILDVAEGGQGEFDLRIVELERGGGG